MKTYLPYQNCLVASFDFVGQQYRIPLCVPQSPLQFVQPAAYRNLSAGHCNLQPNFPAVHRNRIPHVLIYEYTKTPSTPVVEACPRTEYDRVRLQQQLEITRKQAKTNDRRLYHLEHSLKRRGVKVEIKPMISKEPKPTISKEPKQDVPHHTDNTCPTKIHTTEPHLQQQLSKSIDLWNAHVRAMKLEEACADLRKRFRCTTRTLYHLDRSMKLRGIGLDDNIGLCSEIDADSVDTVEEDIDEVDSIQSYAPAADCRICRVMQLEHPSSVCLDCNRYHLRKRYKHDKKPPLEITFDKLDIEKMNQESDKERRSWEPVENNDDDPYESDCSQASKKRKKGWGNNSGPRKRNKFDWKGWFQRDLERHGSTVANANLKYRLQKRKVKPDPVGDDRNLLDYEKEYFQTNIARYQHTACRNTTHPCASPPKTWMKRAEVFNPPADLMTTIHALISIATEFCGKSERQNWDRVLAPLPVGSTARTIWALLFLKSTNGVADSVTCNHYAKLVKKYPNITWSDVHPRNIERVAAILRQTSKWVKNASSTTKILEDILVNHDGIPPGNITDWLRYFEIGPKTAALLQWSLSGNAEWVPVDSHVWTAFRRWEWTTAKTPSECSWQAQKWFPPEYNIQINDAIGSIRQTLRTNPHKRRAMFRKYANSKIIEMLRELDYK